MSRNRRSGIAVLVEAVGRSKFGGEKWKGENWWRGERAKRRNWIQKEARTTTTKRVWICSPFAVSREAGVPCTEVAVEERRELDEQE